MNPEPTIEAMRTAARALVGGDPREQVRAIQTAQDALDAAKAEALTELEARKDYEIDGASTLNTWVRHELRMTAADAHTLVRASATFHALPLVAEAAAAGRIRADHVKAFTYGLKHIGHDIMTRYEEALVERRRELEAVREMLGDRPSVAYAARVAEWGLTFFDAEATAIDRTRDSL